MGQFYREASGSGVPAERSELPDGRLGEEVWAASPAVEDTDWGLAVKSRWDGGGLLEAEEGSKGPGGNLTALSGTGCGQKESRRCLELGPPAPGARSWAVGQRWVGKTIVEGIDNRSLLPSSNIWTHRSQFRKELYAQQGQ